MRRPWPTGGAVAPNKKKILETKSRQFYYSPTAWVCSRSPAGIMVSNPDGGMDACLLQCCELSGRGLCDELITRLEETQRMWYIVCVV